MNITTAFFMPCLRVLERLGLVLLAVWLSVAALPAQASRSADSVTVLYAMLKTVENDLALNAAMTVRLNKTQEEALKKGLSLNFVTDFELERKRSWWLNESLVSLSRPGRLSYNLLTRRYQIESTESYKTYDTLPEALADLGRIDTWIVGPKKLFRPGERYHAALRIRLDQGQLPIPLQINALASGKWEIESDWHEWEIASP